MIPANLVRTLSILRAAYPRWFADMPPEALAAWAVMLSHEDPAAVEKAAVTFSLTSKWPPTIAELLDLVHDRLSADDEAELEYGVPGVAFNASAAQRIEHRRQSVRHAKAEIAAERRREAAERTQVVLMQLGRGNTDPRLSP